MQAREISDQEVKNRLKADDEDLTELAGELGGRSADDLQFGFQGSRVMAGLANTGNVTHAYSDDKGWVKMPAPIELVGYMDECSDSVTEIVSETDVNNDSIFMREFLACAEMLPKRHLALQWRENNKALFERYASASDIADKGQRKDHVNAIKHAERLRATTKHEFLRQLMNDEISRHLSQQHNRKVESVMHADGTTTEQSSARHDCTKCYRPIIPGEEVEAFGTLYHKSCAPKSAKSLKSEVSVPGLTYTCPLCSTDHSDVNNKCDYEECGYCGFDHTYEPEQALAWHRENDPDNKLYESGDKHMNAKKRPKLVELFKRQLNENEFAIRHSTDVDLPELDALLDSVADDWRIDESIDEEEVVSAVSELENKIKELIVVIEGRLINGDFAR